MELNIFFASKIDRIEFLNKELNVETMHMYNEHFIESEIKEIHSIKFKNNFMKIPGYWIELNFNKSQEAKVLYERLIEVVPAHKRNHKVFYPREDNKSLKELRTGWMNKYGFSIKEPSHDKWALFFKELKSHMKDSRMDTVFCGLNLILRYNPFFLKKYRRYYIFEDLAYYYEEQGNLKKAIKCLKLQGMLNPKSTESYLNMSSFYIINGLEEDAIEVCKAGMKKNPQDQYLISNFIIALSNLGNYSFALAFLKNAIEADPNNKLLWKLMGDVYYEMERNVDAIRCYKRAFNTKQSTEEDASTLDTELYNAIGACYFEEKKYEDAVKYFKKALSNNKEDSYAILSIAQIYFYYLENEDLALKYSKRLVDLVPDNGFGQYQLGMLYLNQGNIEKSRWHLYKARQLMPSYEPIHEAIEILKKSSNLAK